MVKYFEEFNQHKLTPTSHYFEKLLQNDKKKFAHRKRILDHKKTLMDNLMTDFNEALNFEGCNSIIGLIIILSIKNNFFKNFY